MSIGCEAGRCHASATGPHRKTKNGSPHRHRPVERRHRRRFGRLVWSFPCCYNAGSGGSGLGGHGRFGGRDSGKLSKATRKIIGRSISASLTISAFIFFALVLLVGPARAATYPDNYCQGYNGPIDISPGWFSPINWSPQPGQIVHTGEVWTFTISPSGNVIDAYMGISLNTYPATNGQVTHTVTAAETGLNFYFNATVSDHPGDTVISAKCTSAPSPTATLAVGSRTLPINVAATSFTPVTGAGGTGTLSYSVSPGLPAGLHMIRQQEQSPERRPSRARRRPIR